MHVFISFRYFSKENHEFDYLIKKNKLLSVGGGGLNAFALSPITENVPSKYQSNIKRYVIYL